MKISDLGEFGLIRRIASRFNRDLPEGLTGIGDDCAVIPWTKSDCLLVTTDLLIEGTHFIASRIRPKDLGVKALAVNLSDIAAMGGQPLWAFLSLGLPEDTEVRWLDAFFKGLQACAAEYETRLLGGDTTRSSKGLVIDIAVIGRAARRHVKFRSTAKAGDVIAVTGCLGGSLGGLRLLQENSLAGRDARFLIQRHVRPRPHIEEGRWLSRRRGVRAMMDVSDGINSDLRRIMHASRCGADIDLDRLPVSPALKRTATAYGWDLFSTAASGGEDYCLLFTADAASWPSLASAFKKQFGRDLSPIGKITPASSGLRYFLNGKPSRLSEVGFEHFPTSRR